MDRAGEEKIIKNTCCLTHTERKVSLLTDWQRKEILFVVADSLSQTDHEL